MQFFTGRETPALQHQTAQKPTWPPCGDILPCFTLSIKLRCWLCQILSHRCVSTLAKCSEFRSSMITEVANSKMQFREHEHLIKHMLKFSWPQIHLWSLFLRYRFQSCSAYSSNGQQTPPGKGTTVHSLYVQHQPKQDKGLTVQLAECSSTPEVQSYVSRLCFTFKKTAKQTIQEYGKHLGRI